MKIYKQLITSVATCCSETSEASSNHPTSGRTVVPTSRSLLPKTSACAVNDRTYFPEGERCYGWLGCSGASCGATTMILTASRLRYAVVCGGTLISDWNSPLHNRPCEPRASREYILLSFLTTRLHRTCHDFTLQHLPTLRHGRESTRRSLH